MGWGQGLDVLAGVVIRISPVIMLFLYGVGAMVGFTDRRSDSDASTKFSKFVWEGFGGKC